MGMCAELNCKQIYNSDICIITEIGQANDTAISIKCNITDYLVWFIESNTNDNCKYVSLIQDADQ